MDKHLSHSCYRIEQSTFQSLLWITIFVVELLANCASFLLTAQVNKLAGYFYEEVI